MDCRSESTVLCLFGSQEAYSNNCFFVVPEFPKPILERSITGFVYLHQGSHLLLH